jgi:hypothetical protein
MNRTPTLIVGAQFIEPVSLAELRSAATSYKKSFYKNVEFLCELC